MSEKTQSAAIRKRRESVDLGQSRDESIEEMQGFIRTNFAQLFQAFIKYEWEGNKAAYSTALSEIKGNEDWKRFAGPEIAKMMRLILSQFHHTDLMIFYGSWSQKISYFPLWICSKIGLQLILGTGLTGLGLVIQASSSFHNTTKTEIAKNATEIIQNVTRNESAFDLSSLEADLEHDKTEIEIANETLSSAQNTLDTAKDVLTDLSQELTALRKIESDRILTDDEKKQKQELKANINALKITTIPQHTGAVTEARKELNKLNRTKSKSENQVARGKETRKKEEVSFAASLLLLATDIAHGHYIGGLTEIFLFIISIICAIHWLMSVLNLRKDIGAKLAVLFTTSASTISNRRRQLESQGLEAYEQDQRVNEYARKEIWAPRDEMLELIRIGRELIRNPTHTWTTTFYNFKNKYFPLARFEIDETFVLCCIFGQANFIAASQAYSNNPVQCDVFIQWQEETTRLTEKMIESTMSDTIPLKLTISEKFPKAYLPPDNSVIGKKLWIRWPIIQNGLMNRYKARILDDSIARDDFETIHKLVIQADVHNDDWFQCQRFEPLWKSLCQKFVDTICSVSHYEEALSLCVTKLPELFNDLVATNTGNLNETAPTVNRLRALMAVRLFSWNATNESTFDQAIAPHYSSMIEDHKWMQEMNERRSDALVRAPRVGMTTGLPSKDIWLYWKYVTMYPQEWINKCDIWSHDRSHNYDTWRWIMSDDRHLKDAQKELCRGLLRGIHGDFLPFCGKPSSIECIETPYLTQCALVFLGSSENDHVYEACRTFIGQVKSLQDLKAVKTLYPNMLNDFVGRVWRMIQHKVDQPLFRITWFANMWQLKGSRQRNIIEDAILNSIGSRGIEERNRVVMTMLESVPRIIKAYQVEDVKQEESKHEESFTFPAPQKTALLHAELEQTQKLLEIAAATEFETQQQLSKEVEKLPQGQGKRKRAAETDEEQMQRREKEQKLAELEMENNDLKRKIMEVTQQLDVVRQEAHGNPQQLEQQTRKMRKLEHQLELTLQAVNNLGGLVYLKR